MIAKKIREVTYEKTATVSFRYPVDLIEALETEAAEKNISVNVLTRQILEKYVKWDRCATIMGLIQIPARLLPEIGKEMKDDVMERMINILHPRFMEWVKFMKGNYDLKRAIESLEEYMKSSPMTFDHRVEGNMHHFIIQHNLGVTWSIFTEAFLKRIFFDFHPEKPIKFRTTENMIIASIALGGDFNQHEYEFEIK